MKRFLFLILLVCGAATALAQREPRIEVKGLILGEHYDDAQVWAALGVPTRFDIRQDAYGTEREYIYGESEDSSSFVTGDLSRFCKFSILSADFPLFGGRLKVGDPLAAVVRLGFGTLTPMADTRYWLALLDGCILKIEVDHQQVITAIRCNLPKRYKKLP